MTSILRSFAPEAIMIDAVQRLQLWLRTPFSNVFFCVAFLSSAPVLAMAGPVAPLWLTGVNLSGGELNPAKNRLNFDYTYPTEPELDYFVGKGLRTFRIPILSARLLGSPPQRGCSANQDMTALFKLIDYADHLHAKVIIDFHQYGGMASGLIGHDAKATAEFADAWAALAECLRKKSNIIFGLMNEPHSQSAAEWLSGANAAIAAIRKADAHQLILVPGSYWSGAHSWAATDNAAIMKGVIDPLHNFAFEVHQYLDSNSSGTSPEVVAGSGADRLIAVTKWARTVHAKLFLGEAGWASSPEALAEGDALLKFVSQNRDVWIGWTYWAAGPWWGDYMFSVEPSKDGDRPQIKVLEKYE